jgi:hypothetical protein
MTATATPRTISARTPNAPYDNGIYQAATRALPAATVTLADLPAYCGPLTDMGRDQRCPRTSKVYRLHTVLDEITRERARQPRVRRDDRARNLAGWVAFAERRLAYYLATWQLPACGCGDNAFAEPTRDTEAALPACAY